MKNEKVPASEVAQVIKEITEKYGLSLSGAARKMGTWPSCLCSWRKIGMSKRNFSRLQEFLRSGNPTMSFQAQEIHNNSTCLVKVSLNLDIDLVYPTLKMKEEIVSTIKLLESLQTQLSLR